MFEALQLYLFCSTFMTNETNKSLNANTHLTVININQK